MAIITLPPGTAIHCEDTGIALRAPMTITSDREGDIRLLLAMLGVDYGRLSTSRT